VLNEQEKRRATFKGEPHSVPVTLKDGQTWYARKPLVRLLPTDDEIGYEEVRSFGEPEFDARLSETLDGMDRALDADDGRDPVTKKPIIALQFSMIRILFEPNYNLTTAEYRELVYVDVSDDTDPLMAELGSISRGYGGKGRTSDGDALSRSLAD
jgi:hypothetical protein